MLFVLVLASVVVTMCIPGITMIIRFSTAMIVSIALGVS